jgi:hypothetical protein
MTQDEPRPALTQADYQAIAAAERRLHERNAERYRQLFTLAPIPPKPASAPLRREVPRKVQQYCPPVHLNPGRPRVKAPPKKRPEGSGIFKPEVTLEAIGALLTARQKPMQIAIHFACSVDLIYKRLREARGIAITEKL